MAVFTNGFENGRIQVDGRLTLKEAKEAYEKLKDEDPLIKQSLSVTPSHFRKQQGKISLVAYPRPNHTTDFFVTYKLDLE